jgi:hypothetical protein
MEAASFLMEPFISITPQSIACFCAAEEIRIRAYEQQSSGHYRYSGLSCSSKVTVLDVELYWD